jgi:hypothetical protein
MNSRRIASSAVHTSPQSRFNLPAPSNTGDVNAAAGPVVDQTENVEKQKQLRRVLDRVQQLPILPGSGVHPGVRRGVDFGGQLTDANRETHEGRSKVARPLDTPLRISGGGPALAPWALTLTMAVSSMVVAAATTTISLNLLQREPSQRWETASVGHAPPETKSTVGAQIDNTSRTPADPISTDLPGRELTTPAAHAELHDWAHTVPHVNAPEGEREWGKQRATAEPEQNRIRRRAAVRGAIEQGPGASASAVGDVLSGGL